MPRWISKLSDEELRRRDAERSRKYRERNREKIKLQKREYRERNALRIKYYSRGWYLAHRKLKRNPDI